MRKETEQKQFLDLFLICLSGGVGLFAVSPFIPDDTLSFKLWIISGALIGLSLFMFSVLLKEEKPHETKSN